MIISRSPLRITLGGGGTDLESFYSKFGGNVISAAINKYVYVTVNRPFEQAIILKYSKLEKVDSINDIQHPIIREALKLFDLKSPQVSITTLADIPSGTGLGSSSSFTTALLKALFTHYRRSLDTNELAHLACEIEIDRLGEPIGKQDQYIAAYGGISRIKIDKSGKVDVDPVLIKPDVVQRLEEKLILLYTGIARSASSILQDQKRRSVMSDSEMLENLIRIKEIGHKSESALTSGDLDGFADLMDQHWSVKRKRSRGISNDWIDNVYLLAIQSGAIGGKLIGAGGGGFFLFYTHDKPKLRAALSKFNLEEVSFRFEFEGSKVILS